MLRFYFHSLDFYKGQLKLATGGIIDHRHPFRLSLDSSKGKKLLENPDVWEKKIKKAIKKGLFKDMTVEGQRKCSYSLLLGEFLRS